MNPREEFSVLLSERRWFYSPGLHVQASSGKVALD